MPIQRSFWLAPLVLAALALAVRLPNLDAPAQFDELYHLLAARSWLDEGELAIAEGVYNRTSLFTIFMAGWFGLLGESLVVARLPSVLAGTALVVLIFLWTRAVAGSRAAWLAGLLFCLSPDSILISQFARFYALHGLLFCLGAIGTYQLVMRPPARLAGILVLTAGTLACYGAAFYLQTVTVIGLGGVGLWLLPALALPWLNSVPERRTRWGLLAALILLLAGAAWLFLQTDLAATLLATYRNVPLWNVQYQNIFWFYHAQLALDYPTLWPLVALAVLIGLAYRPQPTSFCACVFAIAFLAHSFAGPKNIRYVYYMLPFLFVLWGIALAEIWPHLRRFLNDVAARAAAWLRVAWLGQPAFLAAVAMVLGFALVANAAFVKTTALLLGVTLPPIEKPADWEAARAPLEPWLTEADVVLTTSELEALYYLGRYDVLVSKSRVQEIEDSHEFGLDERTGRPVISTPQSLALLMDCYSSGLIVSSDSRWRSPVQLDATVANLITARATEVEIPARDMHAYVWERPPGATAPEACARLPADDIAPLPTSEQSAS